MLNRGGVILTLLLLALVSGSVWGQETYQRVTSVSELEAEKSFLIVNVDDQGRCIALSNEQKKNKRGILPHSSPHSTRSFFGLMLS